MLLPFLHNIQKLDNLLFDLKMKQGNHEKYTLLNPYKLI